MDIKERIVDAAEKLFDTNGFTATGMDQLTNAADVSSRTLYKHVGSKAGLLSAVLGERDRRFQNHIDVQSIDALFDALADWMRVEGARGCLFLRALGETGAREPQIEEAVRAQKHVLEQRIRDIVSAELGVADDELASQVLVLFEGATATAAYRGPEAAVIARDAARSLMRHRS